MAYNGGELHVIKVSVTGVLTRLQRGVTAPQLYVCKIESEGGRTRFQLTEYQNI